MKKLVLVLAAAVVALIVWSLVDADGMGSTIVTWLGYLGEWSDRLAPDLGPLTGSASPTGSDSRGL